MKTDAKVTIPQLKAAKAERKPIAMVTAYDATFGRLVDEAGVDMVLVGDSLGMVMQGGANTLAVTLDEMIYHTRCVARSLRRAHLMADMPFLSYQISPEKAVESAGRLLKEAGAESVKLEGGLESMMTVERLVGAGIPVMAHIGLRPQRVHQMGGYVVQGKKSDAATLLMEEAKAFERAGAFGLLLEGVPAELGSRITDQVSIPTIGIGAGNGCDGQVLVIHDLLGLDESFQPRFAKQFASLHRPIVKAVEAYVTEVRERQFPGRDHSY